MLLRPGAFTLTVTLGLLTALLPLSTDMYLPSLPAIGAAFGAPPALTQLTLSVFLIGMVVGQVFYGPLSDNIGRRPTLLAGMALFALATLLCAAANTVETLIAARFLQALGAAAPIVVARAVVRDLFDGVRAGKELSRMGAVAGLVPGLSPALGGWLEQTFGWRSVFMVSAALVAALGLFVWRALPETKPAAATLGLRNILAEYRAVARSPLYRVYVGLLVTTQAGLIAFISTATYVLQGRYGLGPFAFGVGFGSAAFGYVMGSLTAQRAVTRLGLDGVIAAGVAAQAAAGAVALALMAADIPSALIVILPAMLYVFGHGLVQPQAQAAALSPFPERAGAAASLAGVCQLGFASVYGFAMASALSLTPLILPIGILAAGLGGVTLFLATRRLRA